MLERVVLIGSAVLLAAGCTLASTSSTAAPTPSPTVTANASYGPVETTVTDGLFRLTAHADQATYHASDAIGMHAVVTFLGPAANFPATGSGSGLVNFDVRQLDGPLAIQGVWTADCALQPLLVANKPRTFPFTRAVDSTRAPRRTSGTATSPTRCSTCRLAAGVSWPRPISRVSIASHRRSTT